MFILLPSLPQLTSELCLPIWKQTVLCFCPLLTCTLFPQTASLPWHWNRLLHALWNPQGMQTCISTLWFWRTGISVSRVENTRHWGGVWDLLRRGLSVARRSLRTQVLQEHYLAKLLSYSRSSTWTKLSKQKEVWGYFPCSPVSWSIMNFIVLMSQHFLPQQNC